MRRFLLTLALLLVACSHTATPARAPSLTSLDGTRQSLTDLTARAAFTVVVFTSTHCPCVAAHRERLRALAKEYVPRGVQFFAVDSEVGTTLPEAAREALDYDFALLLDDGARLADALGAQYATYTVVLDSKATVRYRGGIDSDKAKMHPDATLYVKNALDDLVAGRQVRTPEGKTLGCVLRRW